MLSDSDKDYGYFKVQKEASASVPRKRILWPSRGLKK